MGIDSDGAMQKTELTKKIKPIDRQRSPLSPFVLIPKAFFTRYEPTWKAVLTYTALKYYADSATQSCEGVTMKTMAKRVGIGWQSFLRGLQELERKELVKIRHRSKKSERKGRIPLPNLYELVDLPQESNDPI